ncbi:MAG: RDD family protein, partial [Cyanobacteria bacterium J06636_16]
MNLFKKITIQTPESVELEFTLAGIGNRTLALIIDYLLLLLLLLVLGLVAAFLREGLIGLAISLGNNSENTELWLTAIFLLVATTIYSGYFVIFEAWWQGQTPGKRFAKIRVIKDNGKPEGAFQAALRALMRPVDDIFFIGYLCIVFGRKEKRIGDWLAG